MNLGENENMLNEIGSATIKKTYRKMAAGTAVHLPWVSHLGWLVLLGLTVKGHRAERSKDSLMY